MRYRQLYCVLVRRHIFFRRSIYFQNMLVHTFIRSSAQRKGKEYQQSESYLVEFLGCFSLQDSNPFSSESTDVRTLDIGLIYHICFK